MILIAIVLFLSRSLGWDNYQPYNYYDQQQQQYGDVYNDWNSYQQTLHNQGYYYPTQQTHHSYHYEQQPQPMTQHKGNCKHKTTHVEDIKKKDEIVTSTTTTTTTKKPPIIEIDINWPALKKPSHVDDKLHSHEIAPLTNVLNDTIDKVSDQVDKAFTAIKQLVDTSVDDKTGHVHQPLATGSLSLINKFTKRIKAIERHFQKLKGGEVKRIDWDNEDDDDDDIDEELTKEKNDTAVEEVVAANSIRDKEGRSMKFVNDNEELLRTDIKSSISDALKSTSDSFNQLVDEQFDKINKKIADVGEKWDAALGKFYSTLEKLKFTPSAASSTTSTPLIDMSEKVVSVDWNTKTTSPLPLPYASTTPDYFKYTIPPVKSRAENELLPANNVDDVTSDTSRIDIRIVDDENQKSAKSADSAKMMVDELIDTEIEQEGNDKSEIVDESGKSLDDLQSAIVDDVKDRLRLALDVGGEEEATTITPTSTDATSDNDEFDEDEGKASNWKPRTSWCDTFSSYPHHVDLFSLTRNKFLTFFINVWKSN